MTDILLWCAKVGLVFLLWTFIIYWIHRISHIHSKYNPLWKIHVAHHQVPYFPFPDKVALSWSQFIFWHGNVKSTVDIYIVFTIPLLILCYIFPHYAWPILIFHYIYEVWLSGLALDHNLHIKGKITRYFAWGTYHLYHHVDMHTNYGLILTLWDYVFKSAHIPDDNFAEARIAKRQSRGLVHPNFAVKNWPDGNIFGSSG